VPQLLFSGFFVSLPSIPSPLKWLTWLMPLTYTFRLAINEEFGFCSDLGEEEEQMIDCLQALGNSGFNLGSNDGSWLNDNSTMVFPQYGAYTRRESINEYLALYGSPGSKDTALVDSCGVEKTGSVVDYE